MSSKFTKRRHTRLRPPICHTALRDSVAIIGPNHPTRIVAHARWYDLVGTPPVAIDGVMVLGHGAVAGTWSGGFRQGQQTLHVAVVYNITTGLADVTLTVSHDEGVEEDWIWQDVFAGFDPCTLHIPHVNHWDAPGVYQFVTCSA